MFLLNLGYSWKLASELDDVRGIVVLPCGSSNERIKRQGNFDFQRVLFDPQMYLADLSAEKCSKVCARLASYPWFQMKDVPAFESGVTKRRDWDKQMQKVVKAHWPGKAPVGEENIYEACYDAIESQMSLSCSHIILPAPLLTEREDEASTLGAWIDESEAAQEELEAGQPILATVAIKDSALNADAFKENGFLDTIVDQVTSRDLVDGVYIVIMQSQSSHPFDTIKAINKAYLYLSNEFSQHYATVIVNFADVFSFACMGAGCSGIVMGASHAHRRLTGNNFLDKSFGISLPHLYSHKTIAEPLSETDLDEIVNRRLVRRIRDETKHSRRLIQVLGKGGSASELKDWAESRNNTKAAVRHFLARLIIEESKLSELDSDERIDHLRDWLETAAGNQLFIRERLGKSMKGHSAPATDWLDSVDEILD